jgi:hypothetical protein
MKGAEKGTFLFSAEWSMNYLEVPVLLKFDMVPTGPLHPNLFVGPAVALLMSSEISAFGYSADVADYVKSMDFGFVLGAGLDYKRLTLDVRYTMGLGGVLDVADALDAWNEYVEADPGDALYFDKEPSVKNTIFSVMVGFRF